MDGDDVDDDGNNNDDKMLMLYLNKVITSIEAF